MQQMQHDSSGNSFNIPPWRKYLILFTVSWNCLVVTSTSTSILVATPEISTEFRTTADVINITNSGVLIAMGLSSIIWLSLNRWFSRQTTYNCAVTFMLVTSVGTALAPNMGVFTAMRLLTGFTGTYFMVAGQTMIADIFEPLVRGRAVGCMMVGSVAGTAVGKY